MTTAHLPGGLSIAAVGAVLLGLTPIAAAQQQPVFRAGTDLVSLNVTVTAGSTSRYVAGLRAEDFEVFENGVQQQVTLFNSGNSPIALVLLMDTSASMDDRMLAAQEAAVGFARSLRPQDLGELIDFDSRAVIAQSFTNDTALLERAIRKTSAGGATAMFNAIYVALDQLKKLPEEEKPRRQALVIVSDGEDTMSAFDFDGPDGILEMVKRSATAVYAAGLRSQDESAKASFSRPDFVLRQLAQQTGGRAFFPAQIGDLTHVYGEIADELSSQYVVGYSPSNTRRDGTWRRVIVRVKQPDTTVRTRQGYFAPAH